MAQRRNCLKALLFAAGLGSLPVRASPTEQEKKAPRILTIYFTWAGSAEDVAQEIVRLIGGDLVRLETVTPYPAQYDATTKVAAKELKDNARPPIKDNIPDLAGYDIICIGHPIWSGHMPMALYTFFEKFDLTGKTILHFNTHGGSGQGDSHREIARLEPGAALPEGLAVYGWGGVRNIERVAQWLSRLGYLKNEVTVKG